MTALSQSIAAGQTKVSFVPSAASLYRVEISNGSGVKRAEILSGGIASAAAWGQGWAHQLRHNGEGNWQLLTAALLEEVAR